MIELNPEPSLVTYTHVMYGLHALAAVIGITSPATVDYNRLPANARAYLKRLEEVTGTRIDIISTGADRAETIILRATRSTEPIEDKQREHKKAVSVC